MDSTQEQFNQPPDHTAGGQGRPMAANDGQGPTVSHEPAEAHTLNSKEAAKFFEQAGIPRSQRSVERYCKSGKLDCIIDPDEEHWYVSQESVGLLIGQLREIQARHQRSEAVEPEATTSANDGQRPTQETGEDQVAQQTTDSKAKELEDKIWKLELDKGVKDSLLLQAKERMEADGKLLRGYSRLIGQLETQVNHLEIENRQLKRLPPAPTVAVADGFDPEPPTAEEPLQGDEEERDQPEGQRYNND